MMSPFWSGKGGGFQYTDIDVELITIVVTSCGGADGPTKMYVCTYIQIDVIFW